MKKFIFILSIAIVLGLTTFSNATLYDRGGGLIYDDVQNITWLQDANYSHTSGYLYDGVNVGSGVMMWGMAMQWADLLVFAGYDDWRLPTGTPNGAQDAGEMKHLWYELGNIAGSPLVTGPFINVQLDSGYITATSANNDPSNVLACRMFFSNGYQVS